MVKRAGGALLQSVRIDPASSRPIATQLYSALRELMLSGAIATGVRLPATRTLAKDLAVSRTTVIDAFERLLAEGLIVSRVGSGTFVSDVLDAERPKPVQSPEHSGAQPGKPKLSSAMEWAIPKFSPRSRLPHRPKTFVTALPAYDAFPMAQWARISAGHWRGAREDVLGYGEPFGLARLREAIATHLRGNRGITCEKEQIFIVGGAQQAFSLIGSALLDPGDRVWFENPGAIGARNSFIACGAELVPVPVDRDGLMVEEGEQLSPEFRLAFVTPSHQQPLSHIMSLERRFALLQAAQRASAWIIEDDYDGEFFFGRQPVPTLKSVDQTGLVIYVGTFSKSLFPALRLGFMLVPPALVETFERMTASFVQGVPTNVQGIVAEFIQEGHFATHIRRMRGVYAERHAMLVEESRRQLNGLLDVAPTESGLHTVGWLAPAISERSATEAAAKQGIVVSAIARFSIAPTPHNGLVLGFGATNPREIRDGVTKLASVLTALA
ncbi:MAG: GntR family transcriptional regulator [Rhizobiales bacterium PAR1]|nr:MAG: GntR family transcriptional regulator [Rhizobiales bacterium PAR1]